MNIVRIGLEICGRKLIISDVFEFYKNNDKRVVNIIEEWIDNILIGIFNIILVIDLEVIVIGGVVLIYNLYLIFMISDCVKIKVVDF